MAAGFVGPAFALYASSCWRPHCAAFMWAFSHWDGIGARTWAGLYNFKSLLFESDVLWTALGNNLYLMIVPAVIVVPLALLLRGHDPPRRVGGGSVPHDRALSQPARGDRRDADLAHRVPAPRRAS